jgi:hypothetical protein
MRPTVSTYGNTFANAYGTGLDDGETRGDIVTSSLGRAKLTDTIEFTNFEEEVRDYILGMLGHPVIRVELTPFQIKLCIDEAVAMLDYHAPNWAKQFATFKTTAGFGMYEIPTYIMNNLTYVVYKKTVLSIQSLAGTLEQDFFIRYFQENFIFSDFSVGDFYLLQSHLEMIRKVLGNEGSWEVIGNQYLQLMPVPTQGNETVILEYKALDSNTMNPAFRNLIQRYALAKAKTVLGTVRSKFKSLPGPGGGTQLDGELLRQEGADELELIKHQIIDEFEEPPTLTMY